MKKIVDGCTAATYVAYAFSEVATIYPITPVAEMGDVADRWRVAGVKNLLGAPMQVKELESELGAAGATHGALAAGALATTFTSSQGLMLMIPNMYKIAGELLPGVFHVGCRSLATHALSIFGDHQDVMACRATGFTMLSSASVQETHDLGIVAHIAAIRSSLPVLHFFDGWRTSNEMSTIDMLSYQDMLPLVPEKEVEAFRRRALNPEHPSLRGSAQNPDVYFQNREGSNSYYNAFPAIVQDAMNKLASITGRQYHLFDYFGDPEAENIIISIGSSTEVVRKTVEYLNTQPGYHTGGIAVRLYRPFSASDLLKSIPASVKRIAVLDRTKEPGAGGEPLFKDVAQAIQESGCDILITGGRYGLGSKEFSPSMVKAVFDDLAGDKPHREFTVGINDDVTHLSLDYGPEILPTPAGMTSAIFFGMGSDGTVGATKQIASILGNADGCYAQAYFNYSAKKSGGYTRSQLRISDKPISMEYSIDEADYVGCNKDTYANRFELVENLREGGIFVLNSAWSADEMNTRLPARLRRAIARKKVRFYNVDANSVAHANGLGVRINTIMEAVFFKLTGIMPYDKAVSAIKDRIARTYMHEGGAVVDSNNKAVDMAAATITPIDYPADEWLNATDGPASVPAFHRKAPEFVLKVARPCLALEGDSLPVSALTPDGTMPPGSTAFEKRTIALRIPQWNVEKCIECTECSLVCPHAAIRPYLLDAEELEGAPEGFTSKQSTTQKPLRPYHFRIQVYPRDCTGCGSCATICPGHALTMVPLASQLDEQEKMLAYVVENVSIKDNLIPRTTINGSQLVQPLMQFSGACAGCGETPYVKLLTQLFGERMVVANATGCSSIWGANFPSNAYCANRFGQGPAWGNSLFEDNAEYGFGMLVAFKHRRAQLQADLEALAAANPADTDLKNAVEAWTKSGNATTATALTTALKAMTPSQAVQSVLDRSDLFVDKSIWAIGGDGWAYDIGFAGLDHVLAQDENINILVMDTECYSNTGGQTSKATPLGAVAKYASDGKRTFKKDLGRMMMTYGNVYVASIALGANYYQAIKALAEAEAYPGPSIVIAYCPCINHGIRAGMGTTIVEEKNAVLSGYWPLYRYNPSLAAQGQNPLTVDYHKPNDELVEFINGEDRYADLKMTDPSEAAILQPELQTRCDELFDLLTYDASRKV